MMLTVKTSLIYLAILLHMSIIRRDYRVTQSKCLLLIHIRLFVPI